MKHIEILRWNIWRRPDENRNIELQVCVLLFSSQGQNCCCFLLLLCKRKIIACTFHLSGGRMPTQLRGCNFTDNDIDILPCSHDDSEVQDFFPICHLCTHDGFVFSPAPQLAFDVHWQFWPWHRPHWHCHQSPGGFDREKGTRTGPAWTWSIFQPCQFFLGSRDKGNVLG